MSDDAIETASSDLPLDPLTIPEQQTHGDSKCGNGPESVNENLVSSTEEQAQCHLNVQQLDSLSSSTLETVPSQHRTIEDCPTEPSVSGPLRGRRGSRTAKKKITDFAFALEGLIKYTITGSRTLCTLEFSVGDSSP